MRPLHLSALLFGLFVAGCAEPSQPEATPSEIEQDDVADIDASSQALSAPSSIAFSELAVTKSDAKAGLTVLRTAAEYKAFFRQAPPAGLFPKRWVLHYAMGVQPTGGYGVEITSVSKVGSGGARRLEVDVTTHAPGPKCMVTMALTNPQMTVSIKAQGSVRKAVADLDKQTDLCGGCVDASQCPGSKIACKLCADGSAACPETTCNDGECGIVINQCPEDRTCGGFANLPCPDGYSCVDDPNDDCDPANGGADCGGKCVRECTGPLPSCAAPPPGCNYQGGGCVNGNWTCGKLVCGEQCGDVVCGEGTVCCNPLMGICTLPGMVCIQLARARGEAVRKGGLRAGGVLFGMVVPGGSPPTAPSGHLPAMR